MTMCSRWPPLIGVIAFAGHATNWFGAFTPGPATHTAAPAAVHLASTAAASVGGVLSGADSLVSQLFAWLFVLIAFELLCGAFGFVLAEIKLRRMYDRPKRQWLWSREVIAPAGAMPPGPTVGPLTRPLRPIQHPVHQPAPSPLYGAPENSRYDPWHGRRPPL